MTVNTIAQEIYTELDYPSNLSVPQIAYWLLANIGQLNILIDESIAVDSDTGEFTPEMNDDQKAILKAMYMVKWANSGIFSNLGATGYDWSEISEGDSRVRRVSKNEIAKTFQVLRNSYNDYLANLVFYYKKNRMVPGIYDIQRYVLEWRCPVSWIY